jgi:type I restriction enzyme R subunit
MLGLKGAADAGTVQAGAGINPAIQARYEANRLRVVRQVCHSPNLPKDALDLVLFLNGIAVATAELKSDFTQSVHDAVDQYRFDRHPAKPKGGVLEPLLGFPGGALVHFAVSQSRSDDDHPAGRPGDHFLPFNRGNPAVRAMRRTRKVSRPPICGKRCGRARAGSTSCTAICIGKRDDKKQLKAVIFPRYHQLDATRAWWPTCSECGRMAPASAT